MTFIQFIRILLTNLKYMATVALVAGGVVFMLTRNEKKLFSSHTLLHTGLVSGYTIESNQGGKTDYNYTNNELQNLINLATSRDTQEELALTLLTRLIRKGSSDSTISGDNFQYLVNELPESEIKKIKEANTREQSIKIIYNNYQEGQGNPFYDILVSKNELVGIEHLQAEIQVEREDNSDMIRMRYKTIDAATCQLTLKLLTEIFVRNHRSIKENQTTSVLDFFEQSTSLAASELEKVESELLEFQEVNRIINYYEQTRFISGKKEDLDEKYNEELMNQVAADSALNQIEMQLKQYISIPGLNQEVDFIRNKMVDVNKALLNKTFDGNPDQSQISALQLQAEELRMQLSANAMKNIEVLATPEGLETKDLLSQWLQQIVIRERSKARMDIMTQRKQEFEKIYDQFAPLGSRLKNIERKIDIAEKEYLENLHSYNQARLHKHNMLMTTNLKVLDQPFVPAKPEASKRIMLVLLATISGFLVVFAFIISVELLDPTLKSPANAQNVTGLKVAGVLPGMVGSDKKQELLKPVQQTCILQLSQQIKICLGKNDSSVSKVLVTSMQTGEGKSELIKLMQETNPDFKLIELPALLSTPFQPAQLSNADLVLVVSKANRVWGSADQNMMEKLNEVVPEKSQLVLNGAGIPALEDFIGELPKKRGIFRRIIKNMLSSGLKGRKGF